ncbi:hypothetical protein L5515_018011 [Caenorhabditis briggsae]|uniref:Uncharacterized protein n=1 Tax=Caenorhabditis briggsae TaxID=6238 RepID=A0AAE9FEU8_CAEBR|nr:hypothetical protein L5515_018011 [Caenorhabditis briggsae]
MSRRKRSRPEKIAQDPVSTDPIVRNVLSQPKKVPFVRPPSGTALRLWKQKIDRDPLPEVRMEFYRTMSEYIKIEESRLEPIGWGPEDLQTRNIVYAFIELTGAWRYGHRVPRKEFIDVARRVYHCTGRLLSAESCLDIWLKGRLLLRKFLRTAIEDMLMDPQEMESALITSEWIPSYAYMKFAREVFHEYEIELRVKYLGDRTDADNELIKRIEKEDDIRFDDEESNAGSDDDKTAPVVAPEHQESEGFRSTNKMNAAPPMTFKFAPPTTFEFDPSTVSQFSPPTTIKFAPPTTFESH